MAPCLTMIWQYIFSFLLPVITQASHVTDEAIRDPVDIVEVLAGTDTRDGNSNSNGNTLPQVKRPWGFNDWAPQTSGDGGAWWFRRSDTSFEGLRCTHQPSPWIGDYGQFTIQPHVQHHPAELAYSSDASTFRPYLFEAQLKESGSEGFEVSAHGQAFLGISDVAGSGTQAMKFEFTPTSHAGVGRVTFPPQTSTGHISVQVPQGSVSVNQDTISGCTTSSSGGVPAGWKGMHFILKAVTRPSSGRSEDGVGTLEFSNPIGPVSVYVATSFISKEQALLNLKEVADKSFDEIMHDGRTEWNELLNRVDIVPLDETQRSVFYTNLWKASLFPRHLHETDSDGKAVHWSPYTGNISPGRLVADSGFWDSYRTVYPLLSVINPGNLGMLVDGWVHAYKEAGWLPQWPSPGQRTSMVGTMSDVSIADAIAKSHWGFVTGFNVQEAYEAIRKDAFVPAEDLFGRAGLSDYIKKGYIPKTSESESVSRTMNYYLADAAIASAAKILKKEEDASTLKERSLQYRKLFNNKDMFFEPESSSGSFDTFDPLEWGSGFTEAGGWQYRFYVPHDVEGLKDLYKGTLCDEIKNMLTYSEPDAYHVGSYQRVIHEMAEMEAIQNQFGLYAHNNQPVHHVLWVAKKAGCNDVADVYLRKVLQTLYTKSGWSGDEDNGEMASWYVLSALGIYALEGAKDEMVVGSPAVKSATVKLPQGKIFKVVTENQSEKNIHVQLATWTPTGGTLQQVQHNTIKYTELMAGGTLRFVLGEFPVSHHATKPQSQTVLAGFQTV